MICVVRSTTRTTAFMLSAINSRFPDTAIPVGNASTAFVAAPPSPEKMDGQGGSAPKHPLPAMVLMDRDVTDRTRLLELSVTYTVPAASIASPDGLHNRADVGGPPSPLNPQAPNDSAATTELMMPVASVTRRMRLPPDSARSTSPTVSTSTAEGPHKNALVAGPPSPFPWESSRRAGVSASNVSVAEPVVPVPASVEIRPEESTARMRLLTKSVM